MTLSAYPLTKILLDMYIQHLIIASCIMFSLGCEQDPVPSPQPIQIQTETEEPKAPANSVPSLLDDKGEFVDYEAKYNPKPPEDDQWITFGQFRSARPNTWSWVNPKSVTVTCNYILPALDKTEPAIFSIIQFEKGEGGAFKTNLKRWKGLFRTNDGGPITSEISIVKVRGVDATLVEINGEYMGSGAMLHLANHTLIIVIDEHENGNTLFRILGSTDTVDAHLNPLYEFLANIESVPAAP